MELCCVMSAGVDVTDTFEIPEIAFTGDTTADFLNEPGKMLEDVLRARLLIIEVRGSGPDHPSVSSTDTQSQEMIRQR